MNELRNLERATKSGLQDVSESLSRSMKEANKSFGKNIRELSQTITNGYPMQSVDLLVESEIDELKKLVSLQEPELSEYASKRLEDPMYSGMYEQLSDLGFICCIKVFGGGLVFVSVHPSAHWAIVRYEKKVELEEQKKKEAKRQRRMDYLLSLLAVAFGWVLGIISTWVLPVLMG